MSPRSWYECHVGPLPDALLGWLEAVRSWLRWHRPVSHGTAVRIIDAEIARQAPAPDLRVVEDLSERVDAIQVVIERAYRLENMPLPPALGGEMPRPPLHSVKS
jgi:hypothetical protein